MKKYLRAICTVCKRTTDKPVDTARFAPDGCTITLSCQGRLVPLEYRSNANVATASSVGLVDWYPRGQAPSSVSQSSAPDLVNTATGSLSQVVLAVEAIADPGSGSTATLSLSVQSDAPRDYRQYTFRFDAPFSTVSGVEASPDKKTLRFAAYGSIPDVVEVYVNGVLATLGQGLNEYQIFDGNNSVPANLVYFNNSVELGGSTQVDIVVSKAAAKKVKTLTFYRNTEARRLLRNTSVGAWENVSGFTRIVDGQARSYFLFTADVKDTAEIDINTIMTVEGDVLLDTVQVPTSSAFLMLAREPYTQVDRYPDTPVRLDKITSPNFMKFQMVDGTPTLLVTGNSIASLYPPAQLLKLNAESTLKTIVSGATSGISIDGSVVVGPDV